MGGPGLRAQLRLGHLVLSLLVALLVGVVVLAAVTARAKSDAEGSLNEERRGFETAEQDLLLELETANEQANDAEEALVQANVRADRNGSRWMAALAVSGEHSPQTSRLLALEAIRRSATPEARAALGQLLFADARQAAPIATVEHEGPVWAVAISPDGSLVATGSGDGTVAVWEASTGTEIAVLRHDATVWSVAFSPAGTEILSASSDGSARVWSLDSGVVLHRIVHDERVNDARFSPDGTTVVTASHDGIARLFDLESGTSLLDLQHPDIVWAAAVSYDGQRVATAGGDGLTRLFALPEGNLVAEIEHGRPVEVLSFSPDGRFLFAGGQGQMHFLDAGSGQILFSPTEGGRGGVLAIDWHPDGTEAALAALGSGITRFELATGEVVASHRQAGGVRDVKYSPNGEWLAGASGDFQFSFGEISFWEMNSGKRLVRLNLGGPVEALAVDAAASTLAAGYRTTLDQVEIGGAWIVPAERHWIELACDSIDGQIAEPTWVEIVGPDEPLTSLCP